MITIDDLIEKAFSEGYEYAYEERYFADTKKKSKKDDDLDDRMERAATRGAANVVIAGGTGLVAADGLGWGAEKLGKKIQNSRGAGDKFLDVFKKDKNTSWKNRIGKGLQKMGRAMQLSR